MGGEREGLRDSDGVWWAAQLVGARDIALDIRIRLSDRGFLSFVLSAGGADLVPCVCCPGDSV